MMETSRLMRGCQRTRESASRGRSVSRKSFRSCKLNANQRVRQ